MAVKKRGLGRGLDALLGQPLPANQEVDSQDQQLKDIPIDLIQRGKYQPRRDMDPQALEELANSIRVQGVMQPIVVRPIPGDRYEIIAGERRWRATQLAGLDAIPAVIRDVPDEAAIAMALIENIQREDLNPIEEAIALQRLQQEFELTQQQVADAVGKSRVTITNLLRLMSLADDVKLLLERGDIEMGHARALLGLPPEQQTQAARQVVAKGLTVRQAEALVRQLLNPRRDASSTRQNPDIERLQQDLAERIGASVSIQHGAKGKGKLVISYSSLDELDGVLMHIK
ncbi:ParB/RepB/Spo0J family partition protein [Pseudomonas sp. gcc21]|uniref:ParB/RepB/Spo0J family partition protein n=1 Tax=Pseudomonas sp. gcc21 TaxID=2726989 RepID=UPI00145265BD|nr:ParB/RepB/Spo0J family partition protein [Pseudomonas sp. gcc21]QJD59865.1 ParB/RepB/Spo0J family partition protein [Pseudomonas sp. gcc21]